jgi:hypothetical protein
VSRNFLFLRIKDVFVKGQQGSQRFAIPHSRDSADVTLLFRLTWERAALLKRAALWVVVAAVGLGLSVGRIIA